MTDEGRGAAALPELARGWLEAGASGVGGCCRVSADDIRALDRVLRG